MAFYGEHRVERIEEPVTSNTFPDIIDVATFLANRVSEHWMVVAPIDCDLFAEYRSQDRVEIKSTSTSASWVVSPRHPERIHSIVDDPDNPVVELTVFPRFSGVGHTREVLLEPPFVFFDRDGRNPKLSMVVKSEHGLDETTARTQLVVVEANVQAFITDLNDSVTNPRFAQPA